MSISWQEYEIWLASYLRSPLPKHLAAPLPQAWTSDSRKLSPGQWFLPLCGQHFDGHAFIDEALAKGAVGFFYQYDHPQAAKNIYKNAGIGVTDTLAAYQELARSWRLSFPRLEVLALTGSVGKTTTKEMVKTVLIQSGHLCASPGNLNNEVGVPQTLAQLQADDDFALIEMGARKPGDIATLVRIAQPTITACLNAGSAHLEIFQTREKLLATKLEIITQADKAHTVIVPADDPRILQAAKRSGKQLISFGQSPQADVAIIDSQCLADGSMEIGLRIAAKDWRLRLSQAHASYPSNTAAAVAMCLALKLPIEHILAALASFTGIAGRFHIVQKKPFVLIDDGYNANTDSMKAGLQTLAQLYPQQPKLLILGDMLELGIESDYAHRQVGSLCQQLLKPKLLITVGERAQAIAAQAIAEGFSKLQVMSFPEVEALLRVRLPLEPGDVVYAKGSRAMKLDQVIAHYRS